MATNSGSCVKESKKCRGLFCPQDRTALGLMIQKDGNEEIVESFCIIDWTPKQLEALRLFVRGGGLPALPASRHHAASEARQLHSVDLDELKRIPTWPLRVFHLLHELLGPEEIRRVYSKHTIRAYRQHLRDAGFDYPRRPVPTGPRNSWPARDLGPMPKRPRRKRVEVEQ